MPSARKIVLKFFKKPRWNIHRNLQWQKLTAARKRVLKFEKSWKSQKQPRKNRVSLCSFLFFTNSKGTLYKALQSINECSLKRAFFEYKFKTKMHVYPSSKNKDAFRPEKRSVPKRIHKTFGDWQRFLETNHESVFVGKTCVETFGLVRFASAAAVHVRETFCLHTGVCIKVKKVM